MLLIYQDFITENLTVRFTIPVFSVIFKNSAAITNTHTGNLLFIINQRQLLKFLLNFVPNLQYFEHLLSPILDVAAGTFSNLKVRKKI